jgi:hypothetical protein
MTPAETETATALYYTLSTIAQTLAGALAILVAVVLFRLATLKGESEAARTFLQQRGINMHRGWPVLRDTGPEAFAAHVEGEQRYGDMRPDHDLWRSAVVAHGAYAQWGRINRGLIVTLTATVTDMALCFIALPFVPRIVWWGPATGAVLIVTVGLGIICLGLYVRLIAAMVRRPAD